MCFVVGFGRSQPSRGDSSGFRAFVEAWRPAGHGGQGDLRQEPARGSRLGPGSGPGSRASASGHGRGHGHPHCSQPAARDIAAAPSAGAAPMPRQCPRPEAILSAAAPATGSAASALASAFARLWAAACRANCLPLQPVAPFAPFAGCHGASSQPGSGPSASAPGTDPLHHAQFPPPCGAAEQRRMAGAAT